MSASWVQHSVPPSFSIFFEGRDYALGALVIKVQKGEERWKEDPSPPHRGRLKKGLLAWGFLRGGGGGILTGHGEMTRRLFVFCKSVFLSLPFGKGSLSAQGEKKITFFCPIVLDLGSSEALSLFGCGRRGGQNCKHVFLPSRKITVPLFERGHAVHATPTLHGRMAGYTAKDLTAFAPSF